MAADIIQFDRSKNPVQQIVSDVQSLRDARDRLAHARDALTHYRNGADNPADSSNYALLTAACAFQAGGYVTANDAARALFLELDSLLSKLLTDLDVTSVYTAVNQICAKIGV